MEWSGVDLGNGGSSGVSGGGGFWMHSSDETGKEGQGGVLHVLRADADARGRREERVSQR